MEELNQKAESNVKYEYEDHHEIDCEKVALEVLEVIRKQKAKLKHKEVKEVLNCALKWLDESPVDFANRWGG